MREDYCLLFVIALVVGVIMISAAVSLEEKETIILDSMLCEKHVPIGTMLVTDRVIKCTNGKRYTVIE